STDELLRRGELAMYQAKAAGGNGVRFFDPAMQSAVEVRAKLEADLRRAVRYQEFLLYYQLQFDARGNAIGAEALLRWQHASRGMVVPDEFIPLAEQTGLILSMGQWVLCTACQQLAIWQRNPETAHLRIAVNVSARQFRQEGFPSQVISALMGAGAQPHGLQLEITESLLLDDVEAVIGRMDHLKGLGVGFSLDDFGTGYSSLAYLKRLPLEQLKIDRSFVRDILDDPNDATITSTIIALGESLGLMVIAEGVETREQMDLLIRQGCQAFQGYYLCRPVAVGDLPLPKEL
ncbi:MAG: putative bifunctional diguanylate cyclase/phosphodiesterase, partial [Azovibrio sp.]